MYTWMAYKHAGIWNHEKFDTIRECIEEAKEYKYNVGDTIYIGECKDVSIGGIDLSSVLECVEEDMYDRVGEVSEDWNISSIGERKEIYEEYEKKLHQLVNDYLKEINEIPHFYRIINERPITVD